MSEFVEESSATLNGVNEVPGSSASETKGILGFIILPFCGYTFFVDNPFCHDIWFNNLEEAKENKHEQDEVAETEKPHGWLFTF